MTLRYISPFYIFLLLVFAGIQSLQAQYIQVDTTYTAHQLVNKFLGNNNCITVSNISISGWNFGNGDKSYGYFTKGTADFEIDEGIILSTGRAKQAEGSNHSIQSADDTLWNGDLDLENATKIEETTNATVLEFDFQSSLSSKISFQYMFLSEQYLRKGDPGICDYTDGFAFLIKKAGATDYTNLAIIPGTETPITSENVRGSGGSCPAENEEYFGHYNEDGSAINFNGQTVILTAKTSIEPGINYHIKLVIADQGNGLYDSGVFLKTGSFMGDKDLGPDRSIDNNTALCAEETTTLDAMSGTNSTYQWYKDGNEIIGENQPRYTVKEAGEYEVLIKNSGCISKGNIKIEYTEKPDVDSTKIYSECDLELSGKIKKNLKDVNTEIVKNPQYYFNSFYYAAKTDAEVGNSNTILNPEEWEYSDDTTVYVRVESVNCQAVIVPVYFKYNSSRKSALLQNQTICKNTVTILNVENNVYSHVIWFKDGKNIGEGEKLEEVTPGEYTARLYMNNCSYDQEVKVSAAEAPVINNIEVNGSTATVHVSGGTRPYYYSLDDPNNWTSNSNIFTNITRGTHIMYVKDAAGCTMLEKPFIIINLINAITPNGDGINDVLDYSDLKIKENVSLEIFDRHGREVYRSHPNEFVWDGTSKGHAVPTGTYWYLLKWTEPDTGLPVSYSDWILVKNRN